jgi:hypothetical protein
MKPFYRPHILLIDYLAVINNQTPIEYLFHQKQDYSYLRIFCCVCWPNLLPYNTHKLQFRSNECAFIGYSTLHKGFQCLDISTERVYISRVVTFDETVFPIYALHSNAGARLRSEVLLLPSFTTKMDADRCDPVVPDFFPVDTNMKILQYNIINI